MPTVAGAVVALVSTEWAPRLVEQVLSLCAQMKCCAMGCRISLSQRRLAPMQPELAGECWLSVELTLAFGRHEMGRNQKVKPSRLAPSGLSPGSVIPHMQATRRG